MKTSLLSAFGLAVALAVSMPIIGASSADAAPLHMKHHRHYHHHRHYYHHRHHISHHPHHHHHHKMVVEKKA